MFDEGEYAEEKSGVEGVTGEGVAEEGQAYDVTGGEARGGVRVSVVKLPDGKVGDEEELERAEEDGAAEAENGTTVGEPGADENAEEKARVHNGDEAMETDEEVACKESRERKQEGDAAITEHRAGEERHGTDGREIPRMRKDAHCGCENDHYDDENGAKNENVCGRFFLGHDSNQTSYRAPCDTGEFIN